MMAYNRLSSLAQETSFIDTVRTAYAAMTLGGNVAKRLNDLCAALEENYGLSGEVHPNAVVLYLSTSRAKQPSCIVISGSDGVVSPSARLQVSTALATIQVFEGGADDSDVEVPSYPDGNWVQTKGRMLLH